MKQIAREKIKMEFATNLYENPYEQVTVKDDTVIHLHQFGLANEALASKVLNLSPYCMKLEAYLRFAEIPYDIVTETRATNAPRGKVPFIDIDGIKLADSALIINFLKKHYRDIDGSLTPLQFAHGRMLQRTLEDHLYWVTIYYEFSDEQGSYFLLNSVYGGINEFTNSLRADFIDRLWRQGMGRYTLREMLALAREDIDSLSTILGDSRYILGTSAPTSFDAVLYGMTMIFFQVRELHPELTDYIRSKENLRNYIKRLNAIYFPELVLDF